MSAPRDAKMLALALTYASHSRDPSTQVGCVLAWHDALIATGYNRLPDGVTLDLSTAERDVKLKYIVHGEMSAILLAAKNGLATMRTTLYIACRSPVDGRIWGGPPCVRCAVHVIQAGIAEIVTYPLKDGFSKWREDLAESQQMLKDAGVKVRFVELP